MWCSCCYCCFFFLNFFVLWFFIHADQDWNLLAGFCLILKWVIKFQTFLKIHLFFFDLMHFVFDCDFFCRKKIGFLWSFGRKCFCFFKNGAELLMNYDIASLLMCLACSAFRLVLIGLWSTDTPQIKRIHLSTYRTRVVSDTDRTPTLVIKLCDFFKLSIVSACQCPCRIRYPCPYPWFIIGTFLCHKKHFQSCFPLLDLDYY